MKQQVGFRAQLRQRGYSLLEALATTTIAGILAAIALPLWQSLQNTVRLRSAAQLMMQHMHLAKTEAITLQQSVRLSIQPSSNDNEQWCMGLSTDDNCNCQEAASCTVAGRRYAFGHLDVPGLAVSAHVVNGQFVFSHKRGTVTAGHILLTAPNGQQVKVVANGYGRIKVCSPAGTQGLFGYATC